MKKRVASIEDKRKRKFSKNDLPKNAEDYFGTTGFLGTSPAMETASLNISFSIEEALMLSEMIRMSIWDIRRFKHSVADVKKLNVLLFFQKEARRVNVITTDRPVKEAVEEEQT